MDAGFGELLIFPGHLCAFSSLLWFCPASLSLTGPEPGCIACGGRGGRAVLGELNSESALPAVQFAQPHLLAAKPGSPLHIFEGLRPDFCLVLCLG